MRVVSVQIVRWWEISTVKPGFFSLFNSSMCLKHWSANALNGYYSIEITYPFKIFTDNCLKNTEELNKINTIVIHYDSMHNVQLIFSFHGAIIFGISCIIISYQVTIDKIVQLKHRWAELVLAVFLIILQDCLWRGLDDFFFNQRRSNRRSRMNRRSIKYTFAKRKLRKMVVNQNIIIAEVIDVDINSHWILTTDSHNLSSSHSSAMHISLC